jgi:glyoxylase-like metal-dependent hydrolase (beta-lactamase superfamily II)
MLIANIHIVIVDDYIALIDTGTGIEESNDHLRMGLATLRDEWNEHFTWEDLKRIVVTHAHIDHYGGLGMVRSQTSAPIAVHVLDRRVLTNHEERLLLASRALSGFLWRAGISEASHASLMSMYNWSKDLFRSVEVETVIQDGDLLDNLFLVHHTPGHCPGQVCLQIGDVLFSADHVLPYTSPHMAPESITPSTGLEHYLQALDKIAAVPGIRLALGGHEEPIDNLYARVDQIKSSHMRKLERIRSACREPRTINDLASAIYPTVRGYDILLALEEIGAHVEYLDQRGELEIANLAEVAEQHQAALQYRLI